MKPTHASPLQASETTSPVAAPDPASSSITAPSQAIPAEREILLSLVLEGLGFRTRKARVALLRVLLLRQVSDADFIAALTPDKKNASWLTHHQAGYAQYLGELPVIGRLHRMGESAAFLSPDKAFDPILRSTVPSAMVFRCWLFHGLQLRCLRNTFHTEGPSGDTLARWCESRQPVGRTQEGFGAIIERDIVGPLGLLDGLSWPDLPLEDRPVALVLHGGLEDTVARRIDYLRHLVSYEDRFKQSTRPWPLYYPSNPRGLFNHEPSTAVLLAQWFCDRYGASRWGSPSEAEGLIRAVLLAPAYKNTPWYRPDALAELKTAIKTVLGLGEDSPWPEAGYIHEVKQANGAPWQAFERAGHGHLVGWPSAFDMVERHWQGLIDEVPVLAHTCILHHLPLWVEDASGKHALATTEDSLLAVYEALQGMDMAGVIAISDNEGHQTRYQQAQTEGLLGRWGLPLCTVSPSAITWRLDTALDNLAKTVYVQQVYGPEGLTPPELAAQHAAQRHRVYSPLTGEALPWPDLHEPITPLSALWGPGPYQQLKIDISSLVYQKVVLKFPLLLNNELALLPVTADLRPFGGSGYVHIACAHNTPFFGALLATCWAAYPDRGALAAISERWYQDPHALAILDRYTGDGPAPFPRLPAGTSMPATLEAIAQAFQRPLWVWDEEAPLRIIGASYPGEPIMLAKEAQGLWAFYEAAEKLPAFIPSVYHRYSPLVATPSLTEGVLQGSSLPSAKPLSQPSLADANAALIEAREAAEQGDLATAGPQYALALKQANAREQVDASVSAKADKANRWVQLESLMGLAAYHGRDLAARSGADAPLTRLQARQYSWVWGIYRYAFAMAETTWQDRGRLGLTQTERTQLNAWKDQCLTGSEAHFAQLMPRPLTGWVQLVQRQRGYRRILTQLRDTMKQRLAALNKQWPWPVPTNEAEAAALVTLASEQRSGETYSEALEGLYDTIRDTMIELTAAIFQDALQDAGPAPCGYALLGLGSLARGEMTPYSDVECVLLIEQETPETRQYFRRASTLFQGWMIQLQETILPSLSIPGLNEEPGQKTDFYDHGLYIRRGCSLDGSMSHASKTPLGRLGTGAKPWGVELIQTPEAMASYATSWSDQREGHHLAEMLSASILLTHSEAGERLYEAFTGRVEAITQAQEDGLRSLRQRRAWRALKEDMERFNPSIDFGDDGAPVEVKKGLYRLPTLLIHGLATLAGCPAHRTGIQELDYLRSQGRVNEVTYPILHLWLSLAKAARLQIYLARGAQEDRQSFVGKTPFDKRPAQGSLHGKPVEEDPVPVGLMVRWYQMALPVHERLQRAMYVQELIPQLVSRLASGTSGGRAVLRKARFQLTALDGVYTAAPDHLLGICQRLWLNDTALDWANHWIHALLQETRAVSSAQGKGPRHRFKKKAAPLSASRHQQLSDAYKAKASLLASYGDKAHAVEGYSAAEEALTHAEKGYGEKAQASASILKVMGLLADAQGQTPLAERHWQQALSLLECHSGRGHVETAATLGNLGNVAYKQGFFKKAKGYYKRALAIEEVYYGRSHVRTATTLNGLGVVVCKLVGHEAGQGYFERALAIQEAHYGRGHVETAMTLLNLGNVAGNRGAYEEAQGYYEWVLAVQENHYGSGHVETAITLNGLGNLAHEVGVCDLAQWYYQRALAIQAEHYGQGHGETGAILGNLGAVALDLGAYEEAQGYFKRALAIQEEHYGRGHVETAATLVNLGILAHNLGEYGEAQGYLERALAIQREHYGRDRVETAITLRNLGIVACNQGAYEKAQGYLGRALAIQEAHHGPGHVETERTRRLLGGVVATQTDLGLLPAAAPSLSPFFSASVPDEQASTNPGRFRLEAPRGAQP